MTRLIKLDVHLNTCIEVIKKTKNQQNYWCILWLFVWL